MYITCPVWPVSCNTWDGNTKSGEHGEAKDVNLSCAPRLAPTAGLEKLSKHTHTYMYIRRYTHLVVKQRAAAMHAPEYLQAVAWWCFPAAMKMQKPSAAAPEPRICTGSPALRRRGKQPGHPS